MLTDMIHHYEETKEYLYCYPSQYKESFPFLKEVDSLALVNEYNALKTSFKNFFRNAHIGFPNFKSKRFDKNSFTTNNQNGTVRIVDGMLKLPKMDLIKFKLHRQIPSNRKIKSATITKTPTGKYYVSILTEFDFEQPEPILRKSKSIGLDYSSSYFYVDNQNMKANYPKFLRNTQAKLAKAQRKLSKMVVGSKNYLKQKLKIALIHEKIANQRSDWVHKQSTMIANAYDYVCVEDVDLRNMARNDDLKLGKSTNDNGFGMFREQLKYKLFERGKTFVVIDKWFPSSKTCRHCGYVNADLKLERVWSCVCGQVIERDYNSAINIRNEGLRQVIRTEGTSELAC
jgi:putative transposase